MHLKMMGAANNMTPEEMMQLHVNGGPGSEAVDRRWNESENAARGGGGGLQRWPSGGCGFPGPLETSAPSSTSNGGAASSRTAPLRAATAPQLWVASNKPVTPGTTTVLPGVVRSLASMAAAQQAQQEAAKTATLAPTAPILPTVPELAALAGASAPPAVPIAAQNAAAGGLNLFGSIERAVAAAAAGLPLGSSGLQGISASSLLQLLPTLAAGGLSIVGGSDPASGTVAASAARGGSALQLPLLYSLPVGVLGGGGVASTAPPS